MGAMLVFARPEVKETLDEAIAIRFHHDASSNEDSLYSYLKTIKRVFEDQRKE